MRIHLLACEIFFREICAAAARSPNRVDLTFLPKGLHDLGCAGMQQTLQNELAAIDEDSCDAIVLGYALCNNGILGLEARQVPLVVPRAHDCITVFLGSRQRYSQYFSENPGAYYLTSGWIERGQEIGGELAQASVQHQTGMDQSYQDLVDKYGEDNAQYLYEQLVECTHNYTKYTYISCGLETDKYFQSRAEAMAADRGWEFEVLSGDPSLLQALIDGDWNEDEFLVLPPGYRIAADYGKETIIKAEPVETTD